MAFHLVGNMHFSHATCVALAGQGVLLRGPSGAGKSDLALRLIDGDAATGFAASREELRGDLLVQLGRDDEAHAAYTKAKQAAAEDGAIGGLQLKLDDLAKGDA